MIFSGPSGPKFMADAFVVSEKVGEGGPGEVFLRRWMARERRERARGMLVAIVTVSGWPGCGGRGMEGGRACTTENDVRSEVRALLQTQCAPPSSARWRAAQNPVLSARSKLCHQPRGPSSTRTPQAHAMAEVAETTPTVENTENVVDDAEEDDNKVRMPYTIACTV